MTPRNTPDEAPQDVSDVARLLIERADGRGEIPVSDVDALISEVELTPGVVAQLQSTLRSNHLTVTEFEISHEESSAITHVSSAKTRRGQPLASGYLGAVLDPVRAYMQSVDSIMPLAESDERELAVEIEAGLRAQEQLIALCAQAEEPTMIRRAPLEQAIKRGRYARAQMVEAHLRLVVSIAKRYRNRGVAFLDMIQEGNTALVKAVERFDPSRGLRVSTYATWWIRQAMSRAVAAQSHMIRMPASTYDALGKVLRAQQQLLQEHGEEPSVQALARRLKLPESQVRYVLEANNPVIGLDADVGGRAVSETAVDEDAEMPGEKLDEAAMGEALREALAELPDREREVMELRFGLRTGEPRSLDSIGRKFGISRERVRQIESETLKKLRVPMIRHQAEAWLED